MKSIINKLMNTDKDFGAMVARIFLGAIMLPHGMQKLLGAFGGNGFDGTMAYFTGMGMPWIFAFLVIMAESLGSLALILGLVGRFMAFGIFCVMMGAISVHFNNGFFMNWFGANAGEGFEYHLLAVGLALSIMIRGSGAASIDCLVSRKNKITTK